MPASHVTSNQFSWAPDIPQNTVDSLGPHVCDEIVVFIHFHPSFPLLAL